MLEDSNPVVIKTNKAHFHLNDSLKNRTFFIEPLKILATSIGVLIVLRVLQFCRCHLFQNVMLCLTFVY